MNLFLDGGRLKFLLFLVGVMAIFCIAFVDKHNRAPSVNLLPLNEGSGQNTVQLSEQSVVSPPSSNTIHDGLRIVSSSADVYGKFSGTKAQIDELNQWRLERGYMPPGSDKEQNAYNGYTEEALRSLAKNGDMVALHVLADRYGDLDYIKANGIDVLTVLRIRHDFLYEAAIRGSTRALMELGIHYAAKNQNPSGGYEEKKAAEIEVLAIYKVATLRGDPEHFIDELRVSKSIRGIEITDADKQHIDLRAKEIYADLQAKRKDMGLDDFDNSVPETVKNYYESKYGKNY